MKREARNPWECRCLRLPERQRRDEPGFLEATLARQSPDTLCPQPLVGALRVQLMQTHKKFNVLDRKGR